MYFHPFITHSIKKDEIQVHPLQPSPSSQKLIVAIQVKQHDLKTFTKLQFSHKNPDFHGIFISDPIRSKESELPYRILYLPQNTGKVQDKYQDLFANLLLNLSNVCLFDISSKYLRKSQNSEFKMERRNYLVMNSYGGQLRKVSIQSLGNKMEIQEKISFPENADLSAELYEGEFQTHHLGLIQKLLSNIISRFTIYKNIINFEEIKIEFLICLALHEWLQKNKQSYSILFSKDEMLSKIELIELQCKINEFQSNYEGDKAKMIFDKIKKGTIKSIREKNSSLVEKCVQEIKQNHFLNIESFEELEMKKMVTDSTMQQYSIPKYYLHSLVGEVSNSIYTQQISKLQAIIQEKQIEIDTLETTITRKQVIEKELEAEIERNAHNISIFNEVNEERMLAIENFEREKQINRKNRIEIETLIIEQKNRIQNEQRLQSIIKRTNEEKVSIFKGISQLKRLNQALENKIFQKDDQIKGLENKVNEIKKLESQSWKAIEFANENEEKTKKYECFVKGLMENFNAFKTGEVQKVNYILERNYRCYENSLKKIQQQSFTIKELEKNLSNSELEREKLKLQIESFQSSIFQSMRSGKSQINFSTMNNDKVLSI